jgi:hypothetical protein
MLASNLDQKTIFKKQFLELAPRYQKFIIYRVQLNSTVRTVGTQPCGTLKKEMLLFCYFMERQGRAIA